MRDGSEAIWLATRGWHVTAVDISTGVLSHAAELRSEPLAAATVTADAVTALFDPALWDVVTADETERAVTSGPGPAINLHDVVVRAIRHADRALLTGSSGKPLITTT
ncbi:hypothetical protein BKA04_001577 [Cryobacterium mesophilum]|uniref:hypothetical protein n=1 Tax=Terrimesophilobacter mesophilus TaxID=433647 RepID=UPI00180AC94A|nr:hypothetical protein [Terrimesophilobacter mesophilus]MBB5633354.1 hypothetical protein [Terrimesophilobacter mesophilus]